MSEKKDPEKVVREIKRKKCTVNPQPSSPRWGRRRGRNRPISDDNHVPNAAANTGYMVECMRVPVEVERAGFCPSVP